MAFAGGFIQGPNYGYNNAVAESSGRRCVRLNSTGAYVQFTNNSAANSMIVRYSVPDKAGGGGADYTLSLYRNNVFVGKLALTSTYSWLYGSYPFTNSPAANAPRNFYDEVRTNGIALGKGDVIRLQKDASDTASFYDIDLVDVEQVLPPLAQPPQSLSILNYGAAGNGVADDSAALVSCIAAAASQGKNVWLPPGTFKITQTISIPSNVTISGAGMWHTTLAGDPQLYTNAARRVTLRGNGSNITISDLSITGKLTYRNDTEPNDGLGGSFGTGSRISRVWVEHTKTGAWIVNSQGLVVDSCRFRNTIADGINVCVGMRETVVTNCTARGTGDDCFAIWPASYQAATYTPGINVIRNCTGQATFLGNGGAIYGGNANRIENCLFLDMTYGCGVLLSTTFPVSHGFSGMTVVQGSDLVRCGGFDHSIGWRAALQICLEKSGIPTGVNLNHLLITNSISDGLSIIYPNPLLNSTMENVAIPNYGLGAAGRHGLWARNDAVGSLTVSNCIVAEYRDDSPNFSFNFATSTIPVKVQAMPSGRSFNVDGVTYTNAQEFNWIGGWNHTISTASPQQDAEANRYVWTSWSDGGALSHTIAPATASEFTATFFRQENYNAVGMPQITNGEVVLSYTGDPARTYVLEGTTTLSQASMWTSLETVPADSYGLVTFTNAQQGPTGFFRVRPADQPAD